MNNTKNDSPKKRRGLWWKIPLGIFLLLFAGLAVVILNIDSIAHSQINTVLKRYLSGGGALDAIDIGLKEARIELRGLTINTPQGFGKDPLLALNTFEMDVDPMSLFGNEIVVEQLALKELSVTLVRDKQGQLSPLKLLPPKKPASEPQTGDGSGGQEPLSLPAVRVDSIRIENFSVRLIDQMTGEQWSAGLRIDLSVDGLLLKDLLKQEILVEKVLLALSGVKVDQPPGFGTTKIAGLKRFEVAAGKLNLASPEIIVEQVLIREPSAVVMVNKDGLSNVKRLNQMLFGLDEKKNKGKEKPKARPGEPAAKNKLPVVRFEKIQVESGAFKYRDEALTKQALVFPLDKIQLILTQLRLFDENKKAAPASASVSLEMKQPGRLPTVYFGSLAVIGPVGKGVPPVNSQVRLAGFKLDTLGSLVPPATRTTLGADGFDAGLALALNNDRVNLLASILSDRNVRYDAIHVAGPLDAPKVELGAVLAGVFNRVSEGLVNLGKKGLGAGFKIAGGGVDAAKELGSGTVKVGKNLGEGLLGIGSGMVKMDRKNLKEGLTRMTRDTVGLTADSASGTGRAAGGGLQDSYSNLKGAGALQAWDDGIPARYRAAMKQAQDALAQMPYPPVTD